MAKGDVSEQRSFEDVEVEDAVLAQEMVSACRAFKDTEAAARKHAKAVRDIKALYPRLPEVKAPTRFVAGEGAAILELTPGRMTVGGHGPSREIDILRKRIEVGDQGAGAPEA